MSKQEQCRYVERYPPSVVDCCSDTERVSRRKSVRLWAVVVFLSHMLPAYAFPGGLVSARPGLGVSLAVMQSTFARQAFGFKFEAPHDRGGAPRLTGGVPRLTGAVPGKLIILNLVGPPTDLTEVTVTVGVPSTNPLMPPAAPEVLAENTRYLRAVLQQAMPDWKDGIKWLNKQLEGAGERLDVGVRKGHREIKLLAVNHLSMILLSIRVGQPPGTSGP